MAPFLFRYVQGWVAEDVSDMDDDAYQSIPIAGPEGETSGNGGHENPARARRASPAACWQSGWPRTSVLCRGTCFALWVVTFTNNARSRATPTKPGTKRSLIWLAASIMSEVTEAMRAFPVTHPIINASKRLSANLIEPRPRERRRAGDAGQARLA
jgi:hypothetical protein